MKAIVYDNTRRVAVQQVPDAVIEEPGDVVIPCHLQWDLRHRSAHV
jgi:hypothetical protein